MYRSNCEPDHTCRVCGRKYHACNECVKLSDSGVFAYRIFYDTPECFKIDAIVDMSRKGVISAAEALRKLSEFNLDAILVHDTETKKYIAELQKSRKKATKKPNSEESL